MTTRLDRTRISGLRIKWATEDWERSAAQEIRRRVFCDEQQLFDQDDRDEIDALAIPLVAVSLLPDIADEVVGAVRIHEDDARDGTWWGSRLAVEKSYRRFGGAGVGAGLIRLAVSSARGLGCRRFLANVQGQNALLFQRLHWRALGEFQCHGRLHYRMEADLEHYSPCETPEIGFFTPARGAA